MVAAWLGVDGCEEWTMSPTTEEFKKAVAFVMQVDARAAVALHSHVAISEHRSEGIQRAEASVLRALQAGNRWAQQHEAARQARHDQASQVVRAAGGGTGSDCGCRDAWKKVSKLSLKANKAAAATKISSYAFTGGA